MKPAVLGLKLVETGACAMVLVCVCMCVCSKEETVSQSDSLRHTAQFP